MGMMKPFSVSDKFLLFVDILQYDFFCLQLQVLVILCFSLFFNVFVLC